MYARNWQADPEDGFDRWCQTPPGRIWRERWHRLPVHPNWYDTP